MLTYHLSQRDYVRSLVPIKGPYILLCGLLALVLFGIVYGLGVRNPLAYAVAGLVALFFGYRAHPAFMLRRRYQADRHLQGPLTFDWSNNGIHFASQSCEVRLSWNDIHSWRVRQGMVVVSVMPWRYFDSTAPVEMDRLVELAHYLIPLSLPDWPASDKTRFFDRLTQSCGPARPLRVMAKATSHR